MDMGDISMAGMSDASGGNVKKVQDNVSDNSSMYDPNASNVQVIRAVGAD